MKHPFLIIFIALSLCSCRKNRLPLQIITHETIELTPIENSESIVFDSLLLKDKSKDIKQFYRVNAYKTGWNLKKNRQDLIRVIKTLYEDGINPKTYPLQELKKFDIAYDVLDENKKVKADFLFSETFFNASQHLYNGVLNPKKLYQDWDIEPKKINLPATMHLTLEHEAIPITFDSIRTKNPIYTELKKALATLNELPNYDFEKKLTEKKLKLNDSLPEVKELKNRLTYWGDLDSLKSPNNIFDETTIEALKNFQARNGIDKTGKLDKETAKILNLTKEDRIQKIIINLERWRWFPREFGENYVLVNIPDYNLIVVSQGDTIQQHRIIVGTTTRKTPILSSKLSGIIINPTWTVPPTILKNDLVPAATKNRSYFANRGFTIYDYKGNIVSPEDWNPEKGLNYRYIQKPGKSNSLGRIKFNYKNNYLVYLHDTNNKNNYNKSRRNLSSGCVRVENPFDLADFILKTEDSNYSMKMINQWLNEGKTQHIPLKKSIEIHELYWTAWQSKKGIQYRNDVYNLDEDLYNLLMAKLETETDSYNSN